MMTPLLACVRKGYLSTARFLVVKGADKLATDKNKRGLVFYSVLSENLMLLKLFLKRENCNQTEDFWGWTPLHLAANKGSMEPAELLLEMGASIYRKCNIGQTPGKIFSHYLLSTIHITCYCLNRGRRAAGR